MRTETRTIYTLAELKTLKPDAYAKVLARWQDACDEHGDCPWSDETMASLKAVVKACGAKLRDWRIGPYAQSSIRVECEDEDDETGARKGLDWLRKEVLAGTKYLDAAGAFVFRGECHWTGYCGDDSMIEHVHNALRDGETLTEALEGLADVAREMMEADAEQQKEAESMEANWEGNEYDEAGEEV